MKKEIVQTRRKQKGKKKVRVIALVFYLFLLLLFVSLSFITLQTLFQPSYISPIPFMSKGNLSKETTVEGTQETIEKLLKQKGIKYKSIAYRDNSYIIVLANDAEALFSSKKDAEVQVSSLQLVINRLTIEGKSFKRLDFRFDKPVIVFK